MKQRTTILSSIAAAALVGGSVFAAMPSFAQDSGVGQDPQVSQSQSVTEDGGDRVRPEPGQRFTQVLQDLVDDGTVTDEHVSAIAEAFEADKPQRPEPGEGDGERPSREEVQEQHKQHTQDIISGLVADGTLTSDQGDAVLEQFTAKKPAGDEGRRRPGAGHGEDRRGGPGHGPADQGERLTTALEALIADGTITEGQVTSLAEALEASKPAKPEEGDAPAERPTREEHRQMMQEHLATVIDGLVDDGVFSAAEGAAVEQALADAGPEEGERPRGPRRGDRDGQPSTGSDAAA